jgi:tripartite-type tricarboxylate transporter receptor subunit TctC
MTTKPYTREEYKKFVAQEIDRWAEVVKAANVEPQ